MPYSRPQAKEAESYDKYSCLNLMHMDDFRPGAIKSLMDEARTYEELDKIVAQLSASHRHVGAASKWGRPYDRVADALRDHGIWDHAKMRQEEIAENMRVEKILQRMEPVSKIMDVTRRKVKRTAA